MASPRRRRGCFILFWIVVSGCALLWSCWPWPIAAWINRSLPKTWSGAHGSFTLSQVGGTPFTVDEHTQLHLIVPSKRARELVSALTSYTLPPGSLRGSLSATGTFSVEDLGPDQRTWHAETSWLGNAPQALIRLPLQDVNRLIIQRLSLQTNNPISECELEQLHITTDDNPAATAGERRFSITARCTILWNYMGLKQSVSIERCSAWLHVRWEAVPGGFHPLIQCEVIDLDTPVLSLPLIGLMKRLIVPALEKTVNQSLAKRCEGLVVPPWVPRDVIVEAIGTP